MRCAVLLALAATAWADGKFVSTAVPVVEVPDQQAILVWVVPLVTTKPRLRDESKSLFLANDARAGVA